MGSQTQSATETYKVRLSENALKNIDEITNYIAIANDQPLNAIRVGDSLYESFDRIKKRPFAYRECLLIPTKSKMYRQKTCFKWNIIYRVTGVEIVILGIIHSARKSSKIRALRRVK
jgi:plasmid stabilization system protein ParE